MQVVPAVESLLSNKTISSRYEFDNVFSFLIRVFFDSIRRTLH